MKFTFYLMAAVFAAGTLQSAENVASANSQNIFADQVQAAGKYDMSEDTFTDSQKSQMIEWKAKIPKIFENKDYRLTWPKFWKAQAAQQKATGIDREILKDQQRALFKEISNGNWYVDVEMIKQYVLKK